MQRTRLVVFGASLVVGIAVIVCAMTMCLMLVPRVSVSAFRSKIETELPLGTDRSKVEYWLATQGLSWEDIINPDNGRRVGLGGSIRHVYSLELLGETQIDFEFTFDKKDKLIKVFIDEFTIGL